jgi:hypothetical protein
MDNTRLPARPPLARTNTTVAAITEQTVINKINICFFIARLLSIHVIDQTCISVRYLTRIMVSVETNPPAFNRYT